MGEGLGRDYVLIYVDEVMREVEETAATAAILREKFEAERPAAELLLDARMLRRRIDGIELMLPEKGMVGSARRHAGFLIHYLEKGSTTSCAQDIVDICDHDLPAMVKHVRNWSNKMAYVDVDLRAGLSPLVRAREFDSAIRKAFVILKTRLCNKFGVDESIDGPALVNRIFGKDSTVLPGLDSGERQAYRDLLAGMFGLLRNRYAHNDSSPDLAELDAVIANVNLCLRIVGDFRVEKADFDL